MIFQFHVPTMACSACADTIYRAIVDVDLASIVTIDLDNKQVQVDTYNKPAEVFKAAIVAAGYPVEETT